MLKVNQISIGRFHHFHLARQLEKHGILEAIWTGYPQFKLKDEHDIPKNKIKTFPWMQVPFMSKKYLGLNNWNWLNQELLWQSQEVLDKYVASKIGHPTTLIALSGSGLHTGRKVKNSGGNYICDRGSSHIQFQDELLRDEYLRWGLSYKGIDPRIIHKEENEYELSDIITVPSEFSKDSFIAKGVHPDKIKKVKYGARLDRFVKTMNPEPNTFRVLWVGAISLRKGFFDLWEAFKLLKHPKKELHVIGEMSEEVRQILNSQHYDTNSISFLGNISNNRLADYYSSSHVFVFPSIEDGFGMVQGEAMACGCPVIASQNTGARDLFTNGVEGFIVPIRSPQIIAERMQQLADDEKMRLEMSALSIKCVQNIGGWDSYGNDMFEIISKLG